MLTKLCSTDLSTEQRGLWVGGWDGGIPSEDQAQVCLNGDQNSGLLTFSSVSDIGCQQNLSFVTIMI